MYVCDIITNQGAFEEIYVLNFAFKKCALRLNEIQLLHKLAKLLLI